MKTTEKIIDNLTAKEVKLLNEVSDGISFFNQGFLEELTTDKKHYVSKFMEYINVLEKRAYSKELQTKLGI